MGKDNFNIDEVYADIHTLDVHNNLITKANEAGKEKS